MADFHRLDGRTCLVTGATSGHGRGVARALASLGADVVLLGRDRKRCEDTRDEIGDLTGRRPEILLCDLSSRRGIDRAAAAYLESGRPLHVLVNNAGLVSRERVESADGVEMTLAVNYLATYQLTLRLLGRLRAGPAARIVNVASDMHRIVSLDLDDLQLTRRYSWWRAYGLSKLAIVHFSLELARRLRGSGVTVNAVDPGPVASRIASRGPGLVPLLADRIIRALFPSPDRAARTAVWLASSPEVEGISGCYFKFLKLRAPGVGRDEADLSRRLWALGAELTGVDYDG